jgi:thiol-disulfide isomerase/thioredoxin
VYPVSDARAEIARAVQAAGRDGKHLLLDFGADWCPDCRGLDAVMKDPTVAAFLAGMFHVVRVDIGRRDRNNDLVAEYRATSGEWIPALVALDSKGLIVGSTTADVRVSRRTTADELIAILTPWAPKPKMREIATGAAFTQHGVRVRVALEVDARQRHWLAAHFAPVVRGVHLYGASLPLTGIDGLGRPTRVTITPSPAWRATGPAIANMSEESFRLDPMPQVLPVYPAGPVTLRVPISLASTHGRGDALVTYMGCSDTGCLPPVIDRVVALEWALR